MDLAPPSLSPPTRVTDVIRAALVTAAAFFLASFPARNADIWTHLATGRALVEGDYHFGSDPFSWATRDAYWVNPSWLYDAISYGIHDALGGTALVAVKALLMALLAVLLLVLTWNGPARWLAAWVLLMAFVSMAPYLLLRPMVASISLLGLIYVLLERNGRLASWPAAGLLLVLCALWPNIDEWFLLGPALMFLWWLGGLGHKTDASAQGRGLPWIVVTIPVVAAALLNPHHVHVFTAPALLAPADADLWVEDEHDLAARQSPIEWLATNDSLYAPARWAYGVLVVAGALSFAVRGRAIHFPRLLIWVALFGLSVYRSGAIPFFTAVAGPIAALNLQDWLTQRAQSPAAVRARRLRPLLGLGEIVILATAVGAAWVGWAREWPGQPGRWDLEIDPSLEAAGRQLAAWRAEGKIAADARALPTSAKAAAVLAWVAPEEKSFCDSRAHLFAPKIRADFAAMRRALFNPDTGTKDAATWRALLREHGITHVIVDHADDEQLATGLMRLFGSRLWKLHHHRGRTTVFAMRERGTVIADAELSMLTPPWRPEEADRAPETWPGRDPKRRTWLDAWKTPAPDDPLNRDESLVWLAHFDSQRETYAESMRRQWTHGLAAGLTGLPAGPSGAMGSLSASLVNAICLTLSPSSQQDDRPAAQQSFVSEVSFRFAAHRDEGPVGSIHASIRAARRALAKNPDDAVAYLHLGRAYMRLRRQSRERTVYGVVIILEHLRRIQAATALQHAVRLQPDLIRAHEALAGLYQEHRAFDLALEHVQKVVELDARLVNPARQVAESWKELEKQLARAVRDAQLAARAQGLDAFERARTALGNGLSRQAINTLRQADSVSRGRDGSFLLIELLLDVGETHTVRMENLPDLETSLGPEITRWPRAHLAAADGDYAHAMEGLSWPDPVVDQPEFGLKRLEPSRAAVLVLGQHLLDRAADFELGRNLMRVPAKLPVALSSDVPVQWIGVQFNRLRLAADVAVLRGLLALEAGDMDVAHRNLQQSLRLFDDPRGAGGLARHYLSLMATP